jgi:hypothetical protein
VSNLEFYALRRAQAHLNERISAIEQILEASGIVESVLGRIPWPGDPAATDVARVEAAIIADPAPGDYPRGRFPWVGSWGPFGPLGPGPIPDPAAVDVTRLNRTQLQSALHAIAAQRVRLDGMESMIKERLEDESASRKK